MKRSIILPHSLVFANSTSAIFHAVTLYMPAGDIASIRWVFELRHPTGVLETAMAYETADVEDTPSGGAALGAYRTTADVYYPTAYTDMTSNLAGVQLVRFGWMCKLTSGSTLSVARAGGRLELVSR